MKRTSILLAAVAATATFATPAQAGGLFGHTHYCNCGHSAGSKSCSSSSSTSSTSTSSTSGGSTTSSSSGGSTTSSTSGGSTTSSTSGGTTTSSSGGTQVPEPGMLGMMAMGLIGLGFARRQRRKA